MKVRCIGQLQTKHLTFRPGEDYSGNKVNEHWWVIDAVGVDTDNFSSHFEVIEGGVKRVLTEEDASAEAVEK